MARKTPKAREGDLDMAMYRKAECCVFCRHSKLKDTPTYKEEFWLCTHYGKIVSEVCCCDEFDFVT